MKYDFTLVQLSTEQIALAIEHQQAQRSGKEHWYSAFKVRASKVERDYGI